MIVDWITKGKPSAVGTSVGAVSIALWAGAMGLIMFTALKKLKLLRVSGDEELYGLDIALHKTMAYPEDMMEED
jgi:ammonia channel protein AmtB